MTNWSLYKGSKIERSKKAYEEFVELLDKEKYKLLGDYVNTITKVEIMCNKGHTYETKPDVYKRGSRCPICSGKHSETARIQFEEMVKNEGYNLIGEYKSALTKVEIMCNKGHKYFVTPSGFKSGNRCPICSNRHPERAKIEFLRQVNEEGYKLLGDYVNTITKVEIMCNKGHKYFVTPHGFKNGNRCPICSNRHPDTAKLEFLSQVESENYKILGDYVNTITKVEIQCDKGHKYEVKPSNFKNGNRCPICSNRHPDTAKLEFLSQVESENYKVLGDYVDASTKVEIQCDKGHKYEVNPHNFKTGYRCPICSGVHSETAKLEFLSQVESEGYKLLGEYVNNKTKVKIECDKGHKYEVNPSNFKTGKRCPHCNTTSHGERVTRKVLEECKLGFVQQKKFEGLIGLGGRALSYDFFVEGYLLIEIQGEQHYKSLKHFGGDEKFKIQQEHDRLKREYSINNGYKLLEIPYFSPRDLDNLENTLREELNNLLVLEEAS